MDFKKYLKEKLEKDSKFREAYERKDLENLLIDIGNNIERDRIKKGIKQNELAKKLKTSQSYISRVENGSLSPSIKMLQKIAEAFGGFAEFKIAYNNDGDEIKDTQEVREPVCSVYVNEENKSIFDSKTDSNKTNLTY